MYAEINDARIYFDVDGSGYRPNDAEMEEVTACFVLHGGPGMDHSYFKPWLDPLTESLQLIYVDHRGNGQSEKTGPVTYTIEQMADDLDRLRAYLGLEQIAVLGNSFGGMIAQEYAIRYHERLENLILITTSPSSDFWEEAQEKAKEMATPDQLEVLTDLFEGEIGSKAEYDEWWETMLPLYFYEDRSQVVDQMLKRTKGSLPVANFMFANEIPEYDLRDDLQRVTVPTLVVAGRHDWVTPVSQLKEINELMPNSELVIFEESGHLPFVEEQDTFVEKVTEFLETE